MRCRARRVVVLCIAALIPVGVRATAQTPDLIELNGKTYDLVVNPLETYFAQVPGQRPTTMVVSTGNWRGYVATFAIDRGELVVRDVRVQIDGERQASVMAATFPGTTRVVVRWFTGNLLIPNGKMTRRVHMGYGSEYERYIVIRVVAGAAEPPRSLDRREFADFRRAQFEAYKRTDDYRKAVNEIGRGDTRMTAAEVDRFLFDFASGDYMTRVFK